MRAARLAASMVLLLSMVPAWGAAKGRPHVDTGGDQECVACHQDANPSVVKAWEESPHGVALVKCLVCHGSTGKDFMRVAPPERCRGCHGAQVDSIAPMARKGIGCFTCHQPHSLRADPHASRAR